MHREPPPQVLAASSHSMKPLAFATRPTQWILRRQSSQPETIAKQDATVQTEAEMIRRQMCETLMYGLQDKFEKVAESWRNRELNLRNQINQLQESARALGTPATANVSLRCDVDQRMHDSRPMAATASRESDAVADVRASHQFDTQQLRSEHVAARMRIKQQRREERRQALSAQKGPKASKEGVGARTSITCNACPLDSLRAVSSEPSIMWGRSGQ